MKAKKSCRQEVKILLLNGKGAHIRHLGLHSVDGLGGQLRFTPDAPKGTGKGRVAAVNAGVGKGDTGIPLQEHVIVCLRDLAADFNAEFRDIHMNGIAETHPLRRGDIRIARCLPQLQKVDPDIDVRLCEGSIL